VNGWRGLAACAGQQDLFFDGRREAAALAVCAACPVRRECAAFAIVTGTEFGIWGGMSESELQARRVKSPGRSPVITISRPRGPYRKKAA
jgi:WhiB family transcriptional regulator, redox-sensing transcriptional regulator